MLANKIYIPPTRVKKYPPYKKDHMYCDKFHYKTLEGYSCINLVLFYATLAHYYAVPCTQDSKKDQTITEYGQGIIYWLCHGGGFLEI
jgi:hypothetical protein